MKKTGPLASNQYIVDNWLDDILIEPRLTIA